MKIPIIDKEYDWTGVSAAHLIRMGYDKTKIVLEKNGYGLVRERAGWLSFWRLV